MSERPYSRVYWSVRSDDRFVGIYTDNDHLSTWLRLLISADAAWPAPADLPRSARQRSINALAESGLIELLPGDLFRVHGLDNEREARSTKARESVMHRYNDRSTTVVRPKDVRTTSQAEPSLAEPSLAEPSRAVDARPTDPADAYWTLTGKYPTDKTLAWIDDLARQYGAGPVSWQMAHQHTLDDSAQTLLGRVRDALKRESRQLDRAEQDAEQDRLREKRATGVNIPLLVARHNHGQHADDPDPACPPCHNGNGIVTVAS
jgi:hypothetical protein